MLMLTHEARLAALREELSKRGLDGFVIPISDEHMSEYVGEYAQRLHWLTGFGGSAGSAAVLTGGYEGKGAAIFTDGRYTVQVREQVDGNLFDYEPVPETSPAKWLAANAPEGATYRLRCLAPRHRMGRNGAEAARQEGRRARATGRQSDRCGVGRPPRPLGCSRGGLRGHPRRSLQRRQARRDRRLAQVRRL